ncbi:hypothetical protein [Paraburkholderia sediminicola]|uniref:hypothetical protein n=1 Tax=Paraburkholderia sediminicola TaxID=458836 RepID=UPI0015836F0D|nr:hypothetical protein [Paraburkholderia sediminicola]
MKTSHRRKPVAGFFSSAGSGACARIDKQFRAHRAAHRINAIGKAKEKGRQQAFKRLVTTLV